LGPDQHAHRFCSKHAQKQVTLTFRKEIKNVPFQNF
jgi:hypothetical protein